ncbi:MAG: hypothetical protein KC933_30685 [Myxococcales bacterium]|nr:hypothetical protein [Myxococcales bacterium]MCB9645320.1 hypothetical protein [Deltaproteobacteria bacterium]
MLTDRGLVRPHAPKRAWWPLLWGLALVGPAAGCGEVLLAEDSGVHADSGVTDGDSGIAPDGGATDPDSGAPPDGGDAGAALDAGPDAEVPDSGHEDAEALDSGDLDAGFEDTGPVDTGAQDSGPADVGSPDGGLYTVTLAPTGPGGLTVVGAGVTCPGQCTLSVPAGATLTVQAQPDAQGRLDAWLSPAACVGQGGSCNFSVNSDVTVGAEFVLVDYDLEVRIAAGTGTGVVLAAPSLDCPGACVASYPAGTSVDLEAHGDPGSRFRRWLGDCTGTARTCTVSMSQARLVFAEFESVPQLVSNGQAASLVLGQADFTSQDDGTVITGGRTDFPTHCATDGSRLFLSEYLRKRVLGWNSVPQLSGTSADFALGQNNMVSVVTRPLGQNSLRGPGGLAIFGGRLYALDESARVLVWDSLPAQGSSLPDRVLMQSAWTTAMTGVSADHVASANDLAVSAGRLAVADSASRVLLWNQVPTSGGLVPADTVLGQPTFTSAVGVHPPTASSLGGPSGVALDGSGRLAVADTFNSRILIWNTFPTQNNQPADIVLGQTSFSASAENAGQPTPNAVGLSVPRDVVFTSDSLVVSDYGNQRVVLWTPVPTRSGAPATAVLGAPSLNVLGGNGPSAQALSVSESLCVFGSQLWVVDSGYNRLVRFDLARP